MDIDLARRIIHRHLETYMTFTRVKKTYIKMKDSLCYENSNIPVMITITYEPFTIIDVNDAFVKIFGWTKSEIIGRTPKILQGKYTITSTCLSKKDSCMNMIVSEQKSPVTTLFINHSKNGNKVVHLVTVVYISVTDDDMNEIFVSFFRNIKSLIPNF